MDLLDAYNEEEEETTTTKTNITKTNITKTSNITSNTTTSTKPTDCKKTSLPSASALLDTVQGAAFIQKQQDVFEVEEVKEKKRLTPEEIQAELDAQRPFKKFSHMAVLGVVPELRAEYEMKLREAYYRKQQEQADRSEKKKSFGAKEKKKRELGQTSRPKNFVEEEKRLLRQAGN